MASKLGPRIVTDNLVLALDCADAKSYAGEPTTNLLLYPESINSGPIQESWSGTITQNAVIAPDGTLTATKIEATSGYVYERLYINTSYNGVSFGVGDTITYSVWIKMLDGTETTSNGPYIWNYNSPTYGIVVRDLSGLGPDWKLYKMTYTIQSHQTNFSISYSASNGGVTGTYAIWHPQLEVKSYNTPYVETSRSATDGWVDLSGNSNDGTLVNGVATGTSHYRSEDVILPNSARYLEFDGTDQYINLGTISSGDNLYISQGSIELWFKYSTSQNGVILGWGGGSHWGNLAVTNNWTGSVSNESIVIGSYKSSTDYYAFYVTDGADYYGDGNWHHIVFTKGVNNSTNIACYIDGVQKTMLVAKAGAGEFFLDNIASSQINVGRRVYSTSNAYYNGQVASIKIYSDILTQAEALQNYNSTKSRFS